MILLVGITVFTMMVIGVVLTILEFREIPDEQPPRYENVAAQAQPNLSDTEVDR